ncbi:N-acetylmuramoyl-L-alanine amidase [Kineococcus sp. SYSU DK005]|uniref:N-acetylmuramoyl-L-alanine amidase n=1 Tax=Kineococcus sp. SYSU DK005 TaxID=3383126 RepID=UPI003D7D25E4
MGRRTALAGTGAGLLALLAAPAARAAAAGTAVPAAPGVLTPGAASSAVLPLPVSGSTRSLPLAAAGRAGEVLRRAAEAAGEAAGDAAGGAVERLAEAAGTTEVTVEVPGGSVLGVVFAAGSAPGPVAVRVRRAGGDWGAWTELSPVDSAPDPGTGEAGAVATEPLWTGELGAAQVGVRLRVADLPAARLEVVDPGRWAGDATAAAGARRLSSTSGEPAHALLDAQAVQLSAVAAPAIRSRADWGADEGLRAPDGPAYAGAVRAVVVHHTADPGSYSRAEVPSVIRGMYRYHTVTLGWADLGYNFVVDRFGGIWEGRAGGVTLPVVGAHAGGFNTDTFGVSMMGDFTSRAPSAECLESVAQVIAWKFSLHGVDPRGTATFTSAGGGTARYPAGTAVTLRTINAHRDVGFTACPGNVGFTRMDALRARVAQIVDAGGGVASAVDAKHAASGGTRVLGAPTRPEGPARAGGRYRHYTIGSVYSHPVTGTHFVKGLIRDRWAGLGWENSFLGYPLTDEVALPGGAFNHFEGGSIYWSPRTGAQVVLGAIRDEWARLGWETGFLGYPTTDEHDVPGGRRSRFSGGSITWRAQDGRLTVQRGG